MGFVGRYLFMYVQIGHKLRKERNGDCTVTRERQPEGRRPAETAWRRTAEKERRRQGWNSLNAVRVPVADRTDWKARAVRQVWQELSSGK